MNGTRLAAARAAQPPTGGSADEIRKGATSISPVGLIAEHQWRTLYPYTHPFSRATVVGQGSSADFISVTSYECDLPTGNDLSVITPIYTPQQYDDYNLPIAGSTAPGIGTGSLQTDVQNIDVTPGNSAAIGVIGKKHRRLPFLTGIVPGRGINAIPYGTYPFKKPPDDSPYIASPPQGPHAPGALYLQPGSTDRVVNKPELEVYLTDKGLTYDVDDANGFVPLIVKAGNGIDFGVADTADENRKPLIVYLAWHEV